GKHSGRNAFRQRLKELGIEFKSNFEFNSAFDRFKELADKKHDIFDEDLQALVTEEGLEHGNERYRLAALKVCSQTGTTPLAEVTIVVDGVEHPARAPGSGPVDAAFKAIDSVVQSGTQLQLYSVNNITSGTDSQGEVTVRLEKGGRIVNGHGADTDIVIASAKAYLNALNKLIAPSVRTHPQVEQPVRTSARRVGGRGGRRSAIYFLGASGLVASWSFSRAPSARCSALSFSALARSRLANGLLRSGAPLPKFMPRKNAINPPRISPAKKLLSRAVIRYLPAPAVLIKHSDAAADRNACAKPRIFGSTDRMRWNGHCTPAVPI